MGGLVVDRWTVLADGAWSLDPGGKDDTWCKTIALAEEMYISAIRPIAAPGTHHVTLSLAVAEDGDDCAAGRLGPQTVYAAGPGAGELRMPHGVAMKLRQGQALHMNFHLYNPTATSLGGVSGIEVVRVKAETTTNEAGFVLAGRDDFTLPAAMRTTITQVCRFLSEQTALALIPLMHKLGVQFKTTVTQGSESTVLYDGAFRFDDQSQLPIGPLALRSGDSITTECTYENTTYHPVTPGHAGGEMCFSALLRYPSHAAMECTD